MADNAPWDEETDQIISEIDQKSNDSSSSLRILLLDPEKAMKKPNAVKMLIDIKNGANSYINDRLSELSDERQKITHELESLNMQYVRMDKMIGEKAAGSRTPYIKPYLVDVNPQLREEIIIEQFNEPVETFISKMAIASKYIADISGSYGEYTLGSWLFSADKPYVLSLKQPEGRVITLQRSASLINKMLDDLQAKYGTV